jgi:hypothetical protein
MSRYVRVGVVGTLCFVSGWVVGQWGTWQAHAQENTQSSFTSLLGNEFKVRGVGENEFTNDTKKIALELYRDDRNNNLIYITETGSIAVVPVHK